MTRSRTQYVICGALAAIAGIFFMVLSIDHHVYAPGVWEFSFPFLDNWRNGTTEHHRELNVFFLARKVYSVVAFSIVGVLASPLLPRGRRILYAAVAVGCFSAAIELLQKLTGTVEGISSNLFDVFCGAAGGTIGAVVWNFGARLMRRGEGR